MKNCYGMMMGMLGMMCMSTLSCACFPNTMR